MMHIVVAAVKFPDHEVLTTPSFDYADIQEVRTAAGFLNKQGNITSNTPSHLAF